MKYTDILAIVTAEVKEFLGKGWLLLGSDASSGYDFRCDLLNPKTNETIRFAMDFQSKGNRDVLMLVKIPTKGGWEPQDQFSNAEYLVRQFFCINHWGRNIQEQWFVETEAECAAIEAQQRERSDWRNDWYRKAVGLKPTEQLARLLQSRLSKDPLKRNRNITVTKDSVKVEVLNHKNAPTTFRVYIFAPRSKKVCWLAHFNKSGIYPQHI